MLSLSGGTVLGFPRQSFKIQKHECCISFCFLWQALVSSLVLVLNSKPVNCILSHEEQMQKVSLRVTEITRLQWLTEKVCVTKYLLSKSREPFYFSQGFHWINIQKHCHISISNFLNILLLLVSSYFSEFVFFCFVLIFVQKGPLWSFTWTESVTYKNKLGSGKTCHLM